MDTGSWVVTKVIWELFAPHRLLFLVLVAGVVLLWTQKNKTGRMLLGMVSVLLISISVFPVANLLLLPLENRFPIPNLPANVSGILVLGGAENTRLTMARGQPVLNDSAERLTMFVSLARRFPNAKLVFAGGSGQMRGQEYKEPYTARMFFEQLGLDVSKVVFESKSRHTGESSALSYEMVKPDADEKWILIGTAYRMPRAFGVYKKTGWNIIPYPVDFRTSGKLDFAQEKFSLVAVENVSVGVREWLGLFAYWVSGQSRVLFPGPSTF